MLFVPEQSLVQIDRLLVNRPEERARSNSFCAEALHGFIGIELDIVRNDDTVHPVDVARVLGAANRELERIDVGQQRSVEVELMTLASDEFIQALELR